MGYSTGLARLQRSCWGGVCVWRLLDTTDRYKQRLGVTGPRMKCRKALGNRGPIGPGIRAAGDAVGSARPRPSTLPGQPGSWKPWGWTPSRGSPGNPALRGREGTALRSRWSPREVRARLLCAGRDRTDALAPHSRAGEQTLQPPRCPQAEGEKSQERKVWRGGGHGLPRQLQAGAARPAAGRMPLSTDLRGTTD